MIDFSKSLSTTDWGNMIQISMDSPNVSWNVLKIHSKYIGGDELHELVNFDSCGLHVMHGAG